MSSTVSRHASFALGPLASAAFHRIPDEATELAELHLGQVQLSRETDFVDADAPDALLEVEVLVVLVEAAVALAFLTSTCRGLNLLQASTFFTGGGAVAPAGAAGSWPKRQTLPSSTPSPPCLLALTVVLVSETWLFSSLGRDLAAADLRRI